MNIKKQLHLMETKVDEIFNHDKQFGEIKIFEKIREINVDFKMKVCWE